jgi:urease accessory protein
MLVSSPSIHVKGQTEAKSELLPFPQSMLSPTFSWLAYSQLLDSALPIGGFAHSFGLETLVQEGVVRTIADLKAYVRTMLRQSWACGDAMAVKAVYVYGHEQDLAPLWLVDRMLHVQRAASESRSGALKMGNRLLRLAREMFPAMDFAGLDAALQDGRCAGTHALIHGWISWKLGVPLRQAAEGFLYASTVTCFGAALRLMAVGQTEGQTALASMLPEITAAWEEAADMEPLQLYTGTPAAEVYMMRHEKLYSRLFMS